MLLYCSRERQPMNQRREGHGCTFRERNPISSAVNGRTVVTGNVAEEMSRHPVIKKIIFGHLKEMKSCKKKYKKFPNASWLLGYVVTVAFRWVAGVTASLVAQLCGYGGFSLGCWRNRLPGCAVMWLRCFFVGLLA